MGCCILVDLISLQTGQTGIRFLDGRDVDPTALLERAGKQNLAIGLRHVAREETRGLLTNWELAQIGLAVGIGILLFFSDQKKPLALGLCGGMFVLVLIQKFLITPEWTDAGRRLDLIADNSAPVVANHVATLAKVYTGLEAVKLMIGGSLASYFFAMESKVKHRRRPHASPGLGEAQVKTS
jgi:hypothetical protein